MTSLGRLAEIDITSITGLGPETAKALAKIEITAVLDLVTHYPRRYLDKTKQSSIRDAQLDESLWVFGKVVSSFVDNIVMPPLGLAIGGVDFSDLAVVLREAQGDLAAVTLGYGAFIQSIVDFLIIAAAIFVAIKVMNNLKRKEEEAPAAPPAPSKEEVLLTDIRDLLKQQAEK